MEENWIRNTQDKKLNQAETKHLRVSDKCMPANPKIGQVDATSKLNRNSSLRPFFLKYSEYYHTNKTTQLEVTKL